MSLLPRQPRGETVDSPASGASYPVGRSDTVLDERRSRNAVAGGSTTGGDARTAGARASASNARFRSPVDITAGLFRGRWTALILWTLFWGGKRFYRLLRDLPGIPRKTLAGELQEMERIGLIERRFPRRDLDGIEYTLSRIGESLKPVMVTMYEWGLLVRSLPVAEELAVGERPRTQAEHSRPPEPPEIGTGVGKAAPSDAR